MTGITQNSWARSDTLKNIVRYTGIGVKNMGTIAWCNTPALNVDEAAVWNNALLVNWPQSYPMKIYEFLSHCKSIIIFYLSFHRGWVKENKKTFDLFTLVTCLDIKLCTNLYESKGIA